MWCNDDPDPHSLGVTIRWNTIREQVRTFIAKDITKKVNIGALALAVGYKKQQ